MQERINIQKIDKTKYLVSSRFKRLKIVKMKILES
jgi:hypothetical protein